MKKYLPYLAAAGISGAVLLIYYALGGFFPFGDYTIVWGDMSQQVLPLLCDFKDILAGKASIFYNLQNAGGMNFWGVFLFFLASPFTFLVSLVPKADMMAFCNILLVLKCMAVAASACLFFKKYFKNLHTGFAILFSLSYTFCGYTFMFYQNIVWLDLMALFPLLLLSLSYLEEKGRFLPYALCLSAVVAVNFYLSFMVIIFLVLSCGIYFLFFSEPATRGDRVIKLAAGTIGAGAVTAPFWLPSLMQYTVSARGENLWQSLSSGSFFTRFDTIGILLLCTAVIIPAVIAHFWSDDIWRVKGHKVKFWLILFGLMFVPLLIEPVNKMWHTGNYQAFPGRYGYIFVLIGLILAAYLAPEGAGAKGKNLFKNKPVTLPAAQKSKRAAVVLYGALTAAAVAISVYLWYTGSTVLVSYAHTLWSNAEALKLMVAFFLVAAACYGIGLFLYKYGTITKKVLLVFFAVLVATESFFYCNVFIPKRLDGSYRRVMAMENAIDDDSFFRVKNEEKDYDVNLTGALGYNTLNHYTSLTTTRILHGVRKLGYSSYWMEISSSGGTAISDALLSHKYTIANGLTPPAGKLVYNDNGYYIAENALSLPLGIVTRADLSGHEEMPFRARPYTGEYMLDTLLGTQTSLVREYEPDYIDNIILEHDGQYYHLWNDQRDSGVLQYHIPASGEDTLYYFDCGSSLENNLRESYYGAFRVWVNGTLVADSYPSQSENGILALPAKKGEALTITVELTEDVVVRSFGVFSVNEKSLADSLALLDTAEDFTIEDNTITGRCTAEGDGDYLFLQIPYDSGWHASVNGQKVETVCTFEAFCAVPLTAGENNVVLTYSAPGFAPSLLIAAAGILFLALCWFLFARVDLAWLQRPAKIALGALCIGVFAAVYLLPVAVFFIGFFS